MRIRESAIQAAHRLTDQLLDRFDVYLDVIETVQTPEVTEEFLEQVTKEYYEELKYLEDSIKKYRKYKDKTGKGTD